MYSEIGMPETERGMPWLNWLGISVAEHGIHLSHVIQINSIFFTSRPVSRSAISNALSMCLISAYIAGISSVTLDDGRG